MKLGKKAVGVVALVIVVTAGTVTLVSAGSNGGMPLWDRLWQVWITGGNIAISARSTISGEDITNSEAA